MPTGHGEPAPSPSIWVDADACPVVIKEILFRAAERARVQVTLVANQWLRCPASRFVRAVQVGGGCDVADDEIVRRLAAGDLVVTQDIPLAARVIDKGGVAVSPRGERFTPDSPIRFQKFFLKLLHISEQEIADLAALFLKTRTAFQAQHQPVTEQDMAAVLRHIQTFTPSGVGARDFKECLLIQARALDIIDTPIEQIIQHHLHELERHRYDAIMHHLGITEEQVELAQKILTDMSPKPGADFVSERPEYIIPDIYVYRVGDDYEVVLNEDDLPNLRINPTYKKILTSQERGVSGSTRQYVDQKLRSAMWFIRSVEQRKRTIYKVGQSIVKFQRDFLEYGLSRLKPLVLRDVADDISMHESTVSRVTTNKYIHTPQGVFELKYFFHSGLESSSGDDVSSRAVKEKIKQLIEEENPERPLSDKDLEKKLTDAGIAIARRTIAKYREELNLPSSIHRKRKK